LPQHHLPPLLWWQRQACTKHIISFYDSAREKSFDTRRFTHNKYHIFNYGVDEWQCKRRYQCLKRPREKNCAKENSKNTEEHDIKYKPIMYHYRRMIPKQRLPSS
jgi:hypothetical protein